MEAKLIKHIEPDFYFISNGDGSTFATTDDWYSKHLKCYKLSLKNCQSIELGYDLDELAKREYLDGYDNTDLCRITFKDGFQKAVELMGDKKFSYEDMKNGIEYGIQSILQAIPGVTSAQGILDSYKQSLQKTEWDVEIEMRPGSLVYPTDKMLPKLDADGCLILKRI